MGGVDHDHVGTGIHQSLRPFKARITHRCRGGHPQTAQTVFAGRGVQHRLLAVFQGQQPGQLALPVRDQQLLNPARLHQADRLIPVGGLLQNCEVVRGHHHLDGRVIIAGKTHIAVGHDPDHATRSINNREAGDVIAFLQRFGVGQGLICGEGDRVIDNPALKTLHAPDLAGLLFDREVAVHHAHTTGLRHGDGHTAFGDCIHRGTQQRDIQINGFRHAGPRVSRGGQHG